MAVEDLKGKVLSAQDAVNEAQKTFSDAEIAHGSAKTALDTAHMDATAGVRLADLLRTSGELVAADGRLKKAETAEEDTTSLKGKIEANFLTSEVLEELRRLDSDAREEAAQLKAVATRLELTPDDGRSASIGGASIEVAALTLVVPTEIKFDGYGTIRVTPGGEDIATRQAAVDAATTKLKDELDKHGIGNLQEAARMGGEREAWLTEATIHRATVQIHAPEGLVALRGDVARLKAKVERIREGVGDAKAPDITADEAARRAGELDQKLGSARIAERKASDDLRDARGALQTARNSVSVLSDQRKATEERANTLRVALEQSAREETDENLEKALKEATERERAATEEAGKARTALAESDPDGARRELTAATEARTRVEKNFREKQDKVRDLGVELRALGKDDTAAELEVADGEVARAEAQEGRLSHEAAALTLLLDTLAAEEQVARETFLAPIRDRIAPYLKRLFPGSELRLDDQSLKITHLRRNDQDEPYERLSIGTREQLAVLARLAFADLLDEHGKKSPIILDDALVFSDDRRFEEMQRILDRAAERLQIIVLTCHERAYFDRGWTTKRLEESKSVTTGSQTRKWRS